MHSNNPNLQANERGLSPIQRMLTHPESFDPDKLTVNEIPQGENTILAKIPKIPGRITRRTKADGKGFYIELILSHHYDAETGQNRNKKVIIGEDISYYLKGMMIINEKYHDYISANGHPLPHIKAQWAEEERRKRQQEEETRSQDPAETTGRPEPKELPETKKQPQNQKQSETQNQTENQKQPEPSKQAETDDNEEEEASEVQIRELREKEEELNRREEELNRYKEELDEYKAELDNDHMLAIIQMDSDREDHISLLKNILTDHMELIEAQAKRRPDKPMSLREIRTINEILEELKNQFQNNEIENYLHLAQEPDETTNTPATTYGEMSLLLNAYRNMLHQFTLGRLRMK